jgi:hypothetical protein
MLPRVPRRTSRFSQVEQLVVLLLQGRFQFYGTGLQQRGMGGHTSPAKRFRLIAPL